MKYTRKKRHSVIRGELLGLVAGWKSIRIYGDPYERGYAHGYLLSKELARVQRSLGFLVREFMKITLTEYKKRCVEVILPIIRDHYPEIFQELRGIAAGSSVPLNTLVAWNSFLSMYPRNAKPNRCSAFIATGTATENGDIIMAHNTHADFITGQLLNIVLRVEPTDGQAFVMQTSPGYVASSSDWFLCANGIIGCETTISSINYDPDFLKGHPYFCRIRKAMQYAGSLDEYVQTMMEHNAGDYACSWQFGDTRTGEIMLFELGLKTHSVERTNNGVFYGMNSAMDFKLRNLETNDVSHIDENTSVGARNNRLNYLLNEKYMGIINLTNSKLILADHYDEIRTTVAPSSRNICKHSEADLHRFVGCTDGKVVDSKMASKMRFYGRFGSSCGRTLDIGEYVKKHPELAKWKPHLDDFVKHSWTKL